MVGLIILATFIVVWVAVATIAIRNNQSKTIAIGGGFLASCVSLAAVAAMYGAATGKTVATAASAMASASALTTDASGSVVTSILLDYSIDAPLENVIFRRAYEIATSIPTAKSLCLKVSVRAQDHYGKPLLVDMGGYDFDTADLRELRQYASADALMNDLSNIANNSETFIHFLLPFDIEGILLVSDPRKIDETNRPQCGMWSPNLPEESHAAEMAAPSTASAAPASNRSSNAVSVSDRTDAMNAADTVRAFYFALGTGDGDHANMLMALEKRASPAYQPEAIDAFYGHMAEPLTLVSIDATGPTEYAVRYRYRKQSSLCDGRAVVTTTESDGHFLISKIRPLGNC